MKKVEFKEVKKAPYFEYHLPCGDGLLEDSIFYKGSQLTTDLEDKWFSYLLNLGITDYGSQENFLLYGCLVRLLSLNKSIYLLTFGNTVAIEKQLKPIQLHDVNWKYSFEYTVEDGACCRQFGYQTPKAFLNEMNYSNKAISHRGFQLSELEFQQINSFVKTFDTEVTSWSFIINPNYNKLIATFLNPNKKPRTSEILEFSECIIHLQIGGDEGYLDYVMIQSKLDFKSHIEQIEKQVYDFGNQFEHLISKVGVIDSEEKMEFFQSKLNQMITNEKITQS